MKIDLICTWETLLHSIFEPIPSTTFALEFVCHPAEHSFYASRVIWVVGFERSSGEPKVSVFSECRILALVIIVFKIRLILVLIGYGIVHLWLWLPRLFVRLVYYLLLWIKVHIHSMLYNISFTSRLKSAFSNKLLALSSSMPQISVRLSMASVCLSVNP